MTADTSPSPIQYTITPTAAESNTSTGDAIETPPLPPQQQILQPEPPSRVETLIPTSTALSSNEQQKQQQQQQQSLLAPPPKPTPTPSTNNNRPPSNRHVSLSKLLLKYTYYRTLEQARVVIPIAIYFIIVIASFSQAWIKESQIILPGTLLGVVFGLVFFLEGLTLTIMPLAEMIGAHILIRYRLWISLPIIALLGMLCTYAEPALESLRQMDRIIDKDKSPYLFAVLNVYSELLVLSIAVGVGIGSVFGVARFAFSNPNSQAPPPSTATTIPTSQPPSRSIFSSFNFWDIRALIYLGLFPTLILSAWLTWGQPILAPIVGLAWDCGSIVTGPVTVPIMLAVGIGAAKSKAKRQRSTESLGQSQSQSQPNSADANISSLSGLGVVALASIWPVFTVQIFALILAACVSPEEIKQLLPSRPTLDENSFYLEPIAPTGSQPVVNSILSSLRAILPLAAYLVIVARGLLKVRFPERKIRDMLIKGIESEEKSSHHHTHTDTHEQNNNDLISRNTKASSQYDHATVSFASAAKSTAASSLKSSDSDAPAMRRTRFEDGSPVEIRMLSLDKLVVDNKGMELVDLDDVDFDEEDSDVDNSDAEDEDGDVVATAEKGLPSTSPGERPSRPSIVLTAADLTSSQQPPIRQRPRVRPNSFRHVKLRDKIFNWRFYQRQFHRHGIFIIGLFCSLIGLMIFNLGLTYGLTPLGVQLGLVLPGLFKKVPVVPNSPVVSSFALGTFLTMVFSFVLGLLATLAEPALNVTGKTVEKMSNKIFSKILLQLVVAVGVGVGLAVGIMRIVVGFEVLWILLAAFVISGTLSVWDVTGQTFFGLSYAGKNRAASATMPKLGMTNEQIAGVAFDAAGVTTGPVTVPFVISLTVSFGAIVVSDGGDGFGALASASCVPTVAVLLFGKIIQWLKG